MVNLSSTSLYSIDLLLVLDYREQCGFKTVKNLAVAKARQYNKETHFLFITKNRYSKRSMLGLGSK